MLMRNDTCTGNLWRICRFNISLCHSLSDIYCIFLPVWMLRLHCCQSQTTWYWTMVQWTCIFYGQRYVDVWSGAVCHYFCDFKVRGILFLHHQVIFLVSSIFGFLLDNAPVQKARPAQSSDLDLWDEREHWLKAKQPSISRNLCSCWTNLQLPIHVQCQHSLAIQEVQVCNLCSKANKVKV